VTTRYFGAKVRTWSAQSELSHDQPTCGDAIPKRLVDNAELLAIQASPKLSRDRSCDVLARARPTLKALLAPDKASQIFFVRQYAFYRTILPAAPARAWQPFTVQTLDDPSNPKAVRVPLKNVSDDTSLCRLDLYTFSEQNGIPVHVALARRIRHGHCPVPVGDPARGEATLQLTGQAALDLLGHFLEVEAVDDAMDGHQRFGLLVRTVDVLADVNHADA
jgi:hypothetical protein